MKKEFTTADYIFALIGRFFTFCAVIVGGCMLAGLAIEESRRKTDPEDDCYDFDDYEGCEDCEDKGGDQ